MNPTNRFARNSRNNRPNRKGGESAVIPHPMPQGRMFKSETGDNMTSTPEGFGRVNNKTKGDGFTIRNLSRIPKAQRSKKAKLGRRHK